MEQTIQSAARPIRLAQVMLAGMLCMSVLGAATTYYGPTLIYVAEESRQSLATVGSVLALHGLGFFFSTLTANRLARRFEMRRGTILGCGMVAAGVLGYMLLPFPVNILSAFLVGFGAGTLEVLLNRLVELLAGDEPGAALTRLHSTWGLGAVAIPLAVALVIQLGLNWRWAGVLLLLYLALCVTLVWRWPEFKVDHGPDVKWRRVPWRSILIFVAMFFVYTGVETAVGGWATTFFAQLGEGVLLGALATSFFFLMLTIGRFLFGSRVDRLGFARTVRLSNLLGAGALLLTFFPSLALIGFGLAGLAFSVVFPTMLAWAARAHPDLRAQMTSISIASAGLSSLFVPSIIGITVTAIGAWSLTPILVVTALVVVGLTYLEQRRAYA
jgi:MFS transporter, FHS family, glucose/mannose:H+ symporter